MYQRRRRRTHPRTDFYPYSAPVMILLPNDPARPMMKSSQRLSFWARFSTKFIVLGLLGLGSLTSTVKDPSNQDPTIGAVCGKNSCASENDNRTWRDQAPTEQAPHQPEPTRSQQQGNFPNPERGRNKENGRFREGSLDTTQTSRSHTRVGSHMSQKRDNERAMQREINDLKRRLCYAQRRQSPRHWHTPQRWKWGRLQAKIQDSPKWDFLPWGGVSPKAQA